MSPSRPCSRAAAKDIVNTLLNSNYSSDPGTFVISGQTGVTPGVGVASGTAFALVAANCSWCFTQVDATHGVSASTSDLIPLVYFNNAPGACVLATPMAPTAGAALNASSVLVVGAPQGKDGIAVFYKGNNAAYIKADNTGQCNNVISANNSDVGPYAIAR